MEFIIILCCMQLVQNNAEYHVTRNAMITRLPTYRKSTGNLHVFAFLWTYDSPKLYTMEIFLGDSMGNPN